jgi:hypothetical protein
MGTYLRFYPDPTTVMRAMVLVDKAQTDVQERDVEHDRFGGDLVPIIPRWESVAGPHRFPLMGTIAAAHRKVNQLSGTSTL